MAEAITDLNIDISADGAFQHSLKANTRNVKEKNPAREDDLERYRVQMQKRGAQWLERCRKYLNAQASATTFATFFESDLYEDPSASSETYTQDENSNVFNGL